MSGPHRPPPPLGRRRAPRRRAPRAARVRDRRAQPPHAVRRDRPDRRRRRDARVRRGQDAAHGRRGRAARSRRVSPAQAAPGAPDGARVARPRCRTARRAGAALRRDRRDVRRAGRARCASTTSRGRSELVLREPSCWYASDWNDMRCSGETPRRRIAVAVLGRRVADVGGEVPAGVQRVGAVHEPVARDLRDDRGGGDRGARRVAVDDRAALVAARSAEREAVGQADRARAGDAAAARRAARRGSCGAGRARRSRADAARDDATFVAVRRTIGYSASRASSVVLLGVVERAERADVARRQPLEVEAARAAATSGPGEAAAAGLVGARDEAVASAAVDGGERASPGARWRSRRDEPPAEERRSLGGQYVANAPPMIQSRGTGPQKRLSSEAPRLSPIMK